MTSFAGKTVLITGGAAGIGKETALRFLEDEASVIIWDVNDEAGNAALEAFSSFDSKSAFRNVDVSDYAAVEKEIGWIISEFGKLDVLINNAGITMDRTLKKMEPEVWQKVIDINLTGVYNCTRVAAEQMSERGEGVILNASSVVGLYGNFGQTNYVASKAGVIGMTKTWARELGRKGIRVNAVAPGFIETEMVKKMPEQVVEQVSGKTPLGRLGSTRDIANAYAFLASDQASFITGTVLSVDGGLIL